MTFHYKVMLLVLAVTAVTLWLLRPMFVPIMGSDQYRRRAWTWLLLTAIAYLSQHLLVYALLGGLLILWAGRKDRNPAGLYLFLLMAVPAASVPLPTFGIVNNLLDLGHLRLLSLVFLMPLSFRLLGSPQAARPGKLPADLFVFAYLAIRLVVGFPGSSLTSTMRNVLIMYIEVWLPYFVLSRALFDRTQLTDALSCLALAGLILAPLAAIESTTGWILYAVIPESWGAGIFSTYRLREGALRAGLTAGQPIAMGYFFAIAFGAWLYVRSKVERPVLAALGTLVLLVGLVFPLSKGPWIGAAIILTAFIALGPKPVGKLVRLSLLVASAAMVLMVTPYGDRILDRIPLIGSSGDGSLDYRQQLLQTSLLLLQQNPFFGVPEFLKYMEDLRQGEGIIDLVNTYLIIALSYGGIALLVFLGLFAAALVKTLRVVRACRTEDPDAAAMGSSIIACILGALAMIGTVSPIAEIPYTLWAFAGLALGFCRVISSDLRVATSWAQHRPLRATKPASS